MIRRRSPVIRRQSDMIRRRSPIIRRESRMILKRSLDILGQPLMILGRSFAPYRLFPIGLGRPERCLGLGRDFEGHPPQILAGVGGKVPLD